MNYSCVIFWNSAYVCVYETEWMDTVWRANSVLQDQLCHLSRLHSVWFCNLALFPFHSFHPLPWHFSVLPFTVSLFFKLFLAIISVTAFHPLAWANICNLFFITYIVIKRELGCSEVSLDRDTIQKCLNLLMSL